MDGKLVLTEQFLAVVDGAKALRSALVKRWERSVRIRRCQIHKKRNVLEHLPPTYQAEVRRRMNVAYGMADELEARKLLLGLVERLKQVNFSAAESLREGSEETLTAVGLGLPAPLRRNFATTTPLESVFDGVRWRSGSVSPWRKGRGQMAMRRAAATGLEVESLLHRIKGHKLMNLMINALRTNPLDELKEVG